MTFANVQNGAAITGGTSGGVGTLALTLPSPLTAGTLLVACLVTGQAGVPFKISAVVAGGSNPNTSPGWEWCCTSVNGSGTGGQQVEIWCYRQNPGGITGTTWTVQSGQGSRGHMMEFSSTAAWQIMELFPGLNTAVTTGDTSFPVAMATPTAAAELAIAMFGDNFSTGTAVTWTTPSGWTAGRNTSTQSISMHWASYYQVTGGAGAVSVTGAASTATNQAGWEAALVVFREAAAVAARVGASCSPGTYNDQGSFGFPATKTGSAKEFDTFVGRTMSQSAQVSYQQEGAHLTSGPTSDLNELYAMGAQICWALKPRRTGVSGFTTVAAEQAAVDTDVTLVKQSGINGFICTLYNEYNYGGANSAFGNDTAKNGGDPYGTGNTDTTAKNHWLTYWANYAPILAAHGIPVMTKPSYASPSSCSSWHPPAGTVSGVMADFYYSDSNGKTVYLDASPGTGVPSLQDVCDGVRNPDNTVPSPSNTPIPLGIGEWGRAGGSSTPAWSLVVAWSHTGGGTGHLRDVFAARLAAGKQNAPVIWFENNLGGPNWIHTPGFGGEDQTGIQAELAAISDALTAAAAPPVVVTTTTLPNAALGAPYSQALQVTGGTAPYTWALLTGSLPTGLSLSAAGVISGTPSAGGTFTFTVKATDANSVVGNSGSLSILVPSMSITTVSIPAASVGVAYTTTLAESGGTGPFTWDIPSVSGPLPPGITLSAGGVLSGTTAGPAAPYGFTARVTDSLSNTATAALTLTVSAGATGGGTPAYPQAGFPQVIIEAGFYAAAPVVPAGTFVLDDTVNGVLGAGLLGDSTAWTDITTYARSGTISRASTRVQGPLRTYQAGTGSVVLKNGDGRFDPDNLAGPYVTGGVSSIRPMVPFRVRAVYGGTGYSLFTGFADTWGISDANLGPNYAEITVSGTDGFKVLAGITLPAVALAGNNEPSGARINRVLSDAGWYTDHRRIDAGDTPLQSTGYGDTALNLAQLAADTEIGQLYIDGGGFLTFRERQALVTDARSTVPQGVFGDRPDFTVLTPDDAGFEGSAGTWTGAGNANVARSTSAARTGAASLAVTSIAAGNMTAAHCAAANILTQGLPVAPGQPVACSAWLFPAGPTRLVQAGAQFYDASGSVVGSTLYGTAFLESFTFWTSATATVTAPAGAAFARLSILVQSTTGASEVHYVDDAQLGYSELPYAGVARADDDTTLANDVQITRAGGANLQEAKNAGSIATYLFPRTYARSDVLLQSDSEALSYAQWVLYVSLAGADRFDTLTLMPLRDPRLWPHVLGRDIGDLITVIRRPPGGLPPIVKNVFIAGITHTVDVSSNTWQTQWDLDDASRYTGFLILDDPALGKVSAGRKLAY